MAAARLYDTTRNTMSVPKMLKRAEQEAGTFQRGSGQEVRKGITECQKVVVGLEPVIASIGERRNGWLAHFDPNTIADPNALAARAKLTFPDLERGFKDTEEIVLKRFGNPAPLHRIFSLNWLPSTAPIVLYLRNNSVKGGFILARI